MPDPSASDIALLRAAYAAFNARDIDAALATMAADVAWPKAFKRGAACGHEEVRAYWTEQWSEIDPRVEPVAFHFEGPGRTLVEVHQIVRDLAGAVVADGHVGHRFTIESGLISAMEVCTTADPNEAIRALVDAWCDWREYRALACVLPAWTANNGLTDGWAGLRDALRDAYGMASTLPAAERETLKTLYVDIDVALRHR